MLRSIKDLEKLDIRATDGTIGHALDFFFDDERWTIRYLVVDTGTWLPSRKVLISPIAIGRPDWAQKVLPVAVTKEQVKASPDIDTEKPVSRQLEMSYMAYYGYQDYWSAATQPKEIDPHLRSCNVVMTCNVEASDGDIGHVDGMLVDDETWAVRYLIVNTGNWWLGHHVLIAPQWIDDVRWSDETVSVNVTRQAVKDAPHYDPAGPFDHDQEPDIPEHYGRPGHLPNGKQPQADI